MDNKTLSNAVKDVRELPLWIKYVGAILTVIACAATLYSAWGTYVVLNPHTPIVIADNDSVLTATSTVEISGLLSRAYALNPVAIRQDFLTKYIGTRIYGQGAVDEVTKAGDRFLVDIKILVGITPTIFTCTMEAKNEKELLLLKGKSISFTGEFTYGNVFDHGLALADCVIRQ